MNEVLVILPAEPAATLPALPATTLVPVTSTLDVVVSLKASDLPAVICTDTIAEEEAESVAAAIRERSAPCIEVRLAAWDGESHSPVSAACNGVISGFGVDGVVRAAQYLRDVALSRLP